MDNPLKTAQARVEVEIIDLNDNLPEFEVDFYNISIVENLPNGLWKLLVLSIINLLKRIANNFVVRG